jgi:hypothetical protein
MLDSKRFFTALRIIGRRRMRRDLPHVRRQVRKEATDLRKRIGFRLDLVINSARSMRVDERSAQLLLADLLTDSTLDHGRPGDEELAHAAHHNRKMRGRDSNRSETGHGSEARADHRAPSPSSSTTVSQLGFAGT